MQNGKLHNTYELFFLIFKIIILLLCKKKPVDFDGELRIGDVRYDNMT